MSQPSPVGFVYFGVRRLLSRSNKRLKNGVFVIRTKTGGTVPRGKVRVKLRDPAKPEGEQMYWRLMKLKDYKEQLVMEN
jgi:hypothetical protein